MITQEQFDALKPGDQVRIEESSWTWLFVGIPFQERIYIAHTNGSTGRAVFPRDITEILPPKPTPIAYVNVFASGRASLHPSRTVADRFHDGRTHVLTVYSDGSSLSLPTPSDREEPVKQKPAVLFGDRPAAHIPEPPSFVYAPIIDVEGPSITSLAYPIIMGDTL
jgi:hypothetical protein